MDTANSTVKFTFKLRLFCPAFGTIFSKTGSFSLATNVPAIPAVADYGLLNYPPIRKITRSRKPETCTAPAIVRYSMLGLVFIYFGFQQFKSLLKHSYIFNVTLQFYHFFSNIILVFIGIFAFIGLRKINITPILGKVY